MDTCSFKKVDNIPATLYKYVSVKRALEILLTQEIYFAHRSEFNDPLDGTFAYDTLKNHKAKGQKYPDDTKERRKREQYLEECQKKLDKIKLGFFSMSEKYGSYPMWAHYADQHKGCCLQFDFSRLRSVYNWKECFPFMFTEKVIYSNKLPTIDIAKDRIPHKNDSIYMTKFKHWEYEEEWRAVMYKGAYNPFNKILFDSKCSSFEEDMKGSGAYKLGENFLKGIIFGREMENSDKKAVVAAANNCNIDIYNIVPLKYKSDMVIEPYNPK